jgi:hypothetical protein
MKRRRKLGILFKIFPTFQLKSDDVNEFEDFKGMFDSQSLIFDVQYLFVDSVHVYRTTPHEAHFSAQFESTALRLIKARLVVFRLT